MSLVKQLCKKEVMQIKVTDKNYKTDKGIGLILLCRKSRHYIDLIFFPQENNFFWLKFSNDDTLIQYIQATQSRDENSVKMLRSTTSVISREMGVEENLNKYLCHCQYKIPCEGLSSDY